MRMVVPKPFVKWAGGKAQLLPQLMRHCPSSFDRYLEPFVGGGALLFALNQRKALINDSNPDLMNAYEVIRDSPEELIADLRNHRNEEHYYYEMRRRDPSILSHVERASRFVYLNRTCYNGLWRVNRRNQFNTPFGSYKNPRIVNADLIRTDSAFLKVTEIFCMDYKDFLGQNARKGDFIYLDPPYHPISKYSDFKRYTRDFFGEREQVELAGLVDKISSRGCRFMLSNSHSELILSLYSKYEMLTVKARRNINKNAHGRGAIDEVLVRNYE